MAVPFSVELSYYLKDLLVKCNVGAFYLYRVKYEYF